MINICVDVEACEYMGLKDIHQTVIATVSELTKEEYDNLVEADPAIYLMDSNTKEFVNYDGTPKEWEEPKLKEMNYRSDEIVLDDMDIPF